MRMDQIRMDKYHGLGNDFLVVLDLDGRHPLDGAAARALCHRRRGVGADGLIRAVAAPAPAACAMELYNADGGRAEMSGNGIRCLARALLDAGLAAGPEIVVATDAGPRRVVVEKAGMLSVDMGVAKVEPGPGSSLLVDLGNPHAVVEVQDPYDHDLRREARRYPDLNLELVAGGPGPGELTMRVWERGVGETESCGTGACAAAVAARAWGLAGDRLTVHQPGGALRVELDGEQIVLTGPAVHVFAVEVAVP